MTDLKTPYLDASIQALEKLGKLQLPQDKPRIEEMQQFKAALKRLRELEEVNFNQRRELLIGFEQWYGLMEKSRSSQTFEETVDEYLKSLNP